MLDLAVRRMSTSDTDMTYGRYAAGAIRKLRRRRCPQCEEGLLYDRPRRFLTDGQLDVAVAARRR